MTLAGASGSQSAGISGAKPLASWHLCFPKSVKQAQERGNEEQSGHRGKGQTSDHCAPQGCILFTAFTKTQCHGYHANGDISRRRAICGGERILRKRPPQFALNAVRNGRGSGRAGSVRRQSTFLGNQRVGATFGRRSSPLDYLTQP